MHSEKALLKNFLTRNSQVLIDIFDFNNVSVGDANINLLVGIKDKLKSSSIGIHYKKFFGNSFFLRGGSLFRQVNLDRNYENISRYTESSTSKISGNGLYLSVGAGNEWQWSHFTFGFDWIVIESPLSTQITSYQIAKGESSMSYEQNNYILKTISLSGIHMGASF